MAATALSREKRRSVLAVVGDVMLGRLVSREIGRRDPRSLWGDVLPILADADAVIANLECAISDRGAPWAGTPKTFHFRARPAAIDVLKAANIRYVSLANNHVLDFGEQALGDTLDLLDRAGIAHAGAGRTLAEAQQAAHFHAGELSIAAFALTDNEPAFAAGTGRAGTCFFDPANDGDAWPNAAQIAAERAAGADLVMVSAHLGPNMEAIPRSHLAAFKRALADGGTDIIHGHSAHVVQPVECRQRRIILHDTGDILDDYAIDPIRHNDWSFIFLIHAGEAGVHRLVLRPVVLSFAQVHLARGDIAESICARMAADSAAFGTHLQPCAEGLEIDLTGGS